MTGAEAGGPTQVLVGSAGELFRSGALNRVCSFHRGMLEDNPLPLQRVPPREAQGGPGDVRRHRPAGRKSSEVGGGERTGLRSVARAPSH